jgi:mannose-6-phosphate isomerase-like protein (cupin superfamily)
MNVNQLVNNKSESNNNSINSKVNGSQNNQTMSELSINPNEGQKVVPINEEMNERMTESKFIPNFSTEDISECPMSGMPPLKEVPDFHFKSDQNMTTNATINDSVNASNDNRSDDNSSDLLLLDNLHNFNVESMNDLIKTLQIQTTSDNSRPFNENVNNNVITKETTIPTITPFVNNQNITSFNSSQNETIVDLNQSLNKTVDTMNESTSKVFVDLNEDTNSPKSTSLSEASTSAKFIDSSQESMFQTINSLPQSSMSSQKSSNNDNHNGPQVCENFDKQKKKKSNNKVMNINPINYCAKNYRLIGVNRHSSRLKTPNSDLYNDSIYETIENASWGEIDGSNYDCLVSKWKEDEEMSEKKRLNILSKVTLMKFRPSIFNGDKGVFYCWTAFKDESNRRDSLKCILRLDSGAVKHMRFNGNCKTKLFLLSGQAVLNAENGKQRKTLETGHEIAIPPHTRYQIENKNVEPTYFLCHITSANATNI